MMNEYPQILNLAGKSKIWTKQQRSDHDWLNNIFTNIFTKTLNVVLEKIMAFEAEGNVPAELLTIITATTNSKNIGGF